MLVLTVNGTKVVILLFHLFFNTLTKIITKMSIILLLILTNDRYYYHPYDKGRMDDCPLVEGKKNT